MALGLHGFCTYSARSSRGLTYGNCWKCVCAAINVPAAHTSAQVAIFIFYSFPFLTFPAFFTFPMMAPIHEKRVADNAATLFSCVLMAPVPFYGCFCGSSAFYSFGRLPFYLSSGFRNVRGSMVGAPRSTSSWRWERRYRGSRHPCRVPGACPLTCCPATGLPGARCRGPV